MDARREEQRMVIPFASFATPQTRGFAATLWAGAYLRTSLCRKPLVVNDTTARLASRVASQISPGDCPTYCFSTPKGRNHSEWLFIQGRSNATTRRKGRAIRTCCALAKRASCEMMKLVRPLCSAQVTPQGTLLSALFLLSSMLK